LRHQYTQQRIKRPSLRLAYFHGGGGRIAGGAACYNAVCYILALEGNRFAMSVAFGWRAIRQ